MLGARRAGHGATLPVSRRDVHVRRAGERGATQGDSHRSAACCTVPALFLGSSARALGRSAGRGRLRHVAPNRAPTRACHVAQAEKLLQRRLGYTPITKARHVPPSCRGAFARCRLSRYYRGVVPGSAAGAGYSSTRITVIVI